MDLVERLGVLILRPVTAVVHHGQAGVRDERGDAPGLIDRAYKKGYRDGHSAGYSTRYAAGRAEGYAEGYADGQASAGK